MGMTCTVCSHDERARIDALLLRGASERGISLRFNVGSMSVHRHRKCLRETLSRADQLRAGRVLRKVENLVDGLEEFAAEARTAKQAAAYLMIARELRATLSLMGAMTGEVQAAALSAILLQLGVRSVEEVRQALEHRNATANPSLEDLLADGEALLAFVYGQKPEWAGASIARIGAGAPKLLGSPIPEAVVVEARQTNGNGKKQNPPASR